MPSVQPDRLRRLNDVHSRRGRYVLYWMQQSQRARFNHALEFAAAETHAPYWNAAMNEMRHTGCMHNHMRMYWGKKILEWTAAPEHAYRVALNLNNAYFLDGRGANSYANIGRIFGLHDRPWGERPVYGTVRSMSATGLERKCDIGLRPEGRTAHRPVVDRRDRRLRDSPARRQRNPAAAPAKIDAG